MYVLTLVLPQFPSTVKFKAFFKGGQFLNITATALRSPVTEYFASFDTS